MAYQNRSSRLGLAFVILLLAGGAALYFTVFQKYLVNRAEQLRDAIKTVKSSSVFARITITSKTGGMVNFRLSIVDQDGKAQQSKNYSLKGSDIYLESRIVFCRLEEEKKAFAFPWRVFTDKISPAKGFDIRDISVKDGMPLSYKKTGPHDTWEDSIKGLYATAFEDSDIYDAVREQYITDIYDSSLHLGILGTWESGKSYNCIIHPNGALELLEE